MRMILITLTSFLFWPLVHIRKTSVDGALIWENRVAKIDISHFMETALIGARKAVC